MTLTRTAALLATIAIALSACGGSEEAAPTVLVDAPETVAAPETPAADVPEAPAPDTTPTTEAAPEAPAAEQDETVTTPAPASPQEPAEPARCSAEQSADGGQYVVIGIDADDADGGLVVRMLAGTSYEARDVLAPFTVVDTYVDDVEFPSCLVLSNGAVWWEIASPQLPVGGWVNASFLGFHEADGHGDCVILPDLPETCVGVFWTGNEISSVGEYSSDILGELQHACVYQSFADACSVLAFMGPGDGIGNSLSMAPTDALVTDCATLTGVAQKLACAELATRS